MFYPIGCNFCDSDRKIILKPNLSNRTIAPTLQFSLFDDRSEMRANSKHTHRLIAEENSHNGQASRQGPCTGRYNRPGVIPRDFPRHTRHQ
jgi:hypothetical protein